MSVICPACHGHNRDSARCCTTCGAELTIACPQCQARNKSAARFCSQCGHSLVTQTLSSEAVPKPVPTEAPAPIVAVDVDVDTVADSVVKPTFDPVAEPMDAPVVAAVVDPAPLLHPEPLATDAARAVTPPAVPAPAAPPPMEFMFEDDERPAAAAARQRPVAAYVLAAAAVLAVAGAAAWYLLGRPDTASTMSQTPAIAAPVTVPDAPSAAESSPARAEPVEEIIESERARAAAAAPAATVTLPSPVPASAPAVAEPPFTPVTVPRVADAVPPTSNTKRSAAPTDDAPWPPVARPMPSPGDSLARLRGALAQCAAMSNELSRATCLGRTRQNFCGDAWGRIPECPSGQ